MKTFWYVCAIVTAVLLPIYLSGCGGSDGGSSPAADGQTGRLSISITDAPVDQASSVVVEFYGVEIQPEVGDRLRFEFPPRQIDLKLLTGGNTEGILVNEVLDAGHYEWIRLLVYASCDVTDSFIVIGDPPDSVTYSMWIPSGDQTGLKLNRGFDVPVGGAVDFTVDFDLRKSVNGLKLNGNCAGNYKLRPTLRIVDNTEIGSLSGTVIDSTLKDVSCTSGNAVYVFEGSGVTPDDIDLPPVPGDPDLGGPDPITTAMVDVVDLGGGVLEGSYRVDFLSANSASNDYTVAFTCMAEDDDPEIDESVIPPDPAEPIIFQGAANVTVNEGLETIQDF